MLRSQPLLPNLENAAVLGFSFLKVILKSEGNGQPMATVERVRMVATEHLRLNGNDFTELRLGLRMFAFFIQHKAQIRAGRQRVGIFFAKNLFLNSDNVS